MRTFATMGLLAAALLPVSITQLPFGSSDAASPGIAARAEMAAYQPVMLSGSSLFPSAIPKQRAANSEFVRDRNREAELSSDRIARLRTMTFTRERNNEIRQSLAAYAATSNARFADARNREMVVSMIRAERQRTEAFVAARNSEIQSSLAFAALERDRLFVLARNAERERSFERVAAIQLAAFTTARNQEIAASMAVWDGTREARFAEARNTEIEASVATVEARKLAAFAAERNKEIEISMVRATREIEEIALVRKYPELIETGSIATCSAAR